MQRAILKTLLIFSCISPCAGASADETFPGKVWAQRLLDHLVVKLKDPELDEEDIQFLVVHACHALAFVDVPSAIELARAKLEPAGPGLQLVAMAQSSMGDFDEALETAELIKFEPLKNLTIGYVARAIAKAGDIDRARKTLDLISDAEETQQFRFDFARALIEQGKYSEAAVEYKLLRDKYSKETIQRIAEAEAFESSPGDPKYCEKRIREANHWGGLSSQEIDLLRLECKAREAMHEKDEQSFGEAVRDIHKLIEQWDRTDRSNGLFLIAGLQIEKGDKEGARRCSQDAFDVFFEGEERESHDPAYFGLIANGRFIPTTQVMSAQQILNLHHRLVDCDSSFSVSALASGLSMNKRYKNLEDIYEATTNVDIRYEIALGALSGKGDRLREELRAKVHKASPIERMERLSLLKPILNEATESTPDGK